jgi:predicted dehydrogenase
MNVALIGCSGMGRVHAAMLSQAGFTLAACVDLDKKAATALAKPHGARVLTDAAAALALPGIEVVCIATPTHTHLPLIEAAAKAGKHIFCEKPFCRTAAQCRKAIAAAKKAGVRLFVGHVVRYFHEFEALKAQVDSGAIGTPGFARLYRGGLFPGGPNSWFADYAKSGGVTFDCMIHDLDWLRHAFGEPERIYCQALMRSKPVPMDYSQVTMRMKSGLIASVIGTWAHPSGFQVKAEICGSGGMVQYDSADAPMRALKRQTGSGPSMVVPESPVSESPYLREWRDFHAWLQTGAMPRVTALDALRAVEMAEAALQSAKTGQPVSL